MTVETEVVRLRKHQIGEAGEVLGRAFYDDPFAVYVEPDDAKRPGSLRRGMATAAGYALMYGSVYTTADKVEGVALWYPPGGFPMGSVRMVRGGMVFLPFNLGLRAFVRFIKLTGYTEHLHTRNVPSPHWYLPLLGVDPPRQGQGIGTALMQPVLARADADRLPCYLETLNARNLSLYRRQGFEVVTEGDVPKGGPHVWAMLRAPRG